MAEADVSRRCRGCGAGGLRRAAVRRLADFSDPATAGSARGRGDPEQERLVALRPLDAWGEVWHSLTRLQDETERFALDKRAAIVSSLSLLTGKMP